ncbi:hypothetical protein Tco_1185719, partial [Tanacetum coccineum]
VKINSDLLYGSLHSPLLTGATSRRSIPPIRLTLAQEELRGLHESSKEWFMKQSVKWLQDDMVSKGFSRNRHEAHDIDGDGGYEEQEIKPRPKAMERIRKKKDKK